VTIYVKGKVREKPEKVRTPITSSFAMAYFIENGGASL
jgi:hypothetical protein